MKIMKTILLLLCINLALGQTTLIDPALYARKYKVNDPYTNLKNNIPRNVQTQKKINTITGTPKVEKIYPKSISKAIINYKSSIEQNKVYFVQVYSNSDKNKVIEMKGRAKVAYPQYSIQS